MERMITTVLTLLGRRLLAAIPILLVVSALLFCALRVLPVDPAAMSLPPTATIAEVEAKRREIIIAASIPSNSSSYIPLALNDLIGTRFKIVRGFPGSPPMALAMERGAVDAIGGISLESVQLSKADWLTEKKAKALYAHGARRIKELPDDPALPELAIDDRSRRILELLGGGPDIGRSVVAEPGIPPERARALRKAFMETMEDPEFVADMGRRHLGVEPLPGEEVQQIIARAVATPRELVEQAAHYASGQ